RATRASRGRFSTLSPSAASRTGVSAANGQIAWAAAAGQIVVANPGGTAQHSLGPPWKAGAPLWSPDGSRLLVNATRPNTPDRPATINADGSGPTLLDVAPKNTFLGCSAWSPDGTRLLCGEGSDQDPAPCGVYSMRTSDGGDLSRLTVCLSEGYDWPGD